MSAADVVLALFDQLPLYQVNPTAEQFLEFALHLEHVEEGGSGAAAKVTSTSTSLSVRKSSRNTDPNRQNCDLPLPTEVCDLLLRNFELSGAGTNHLRAG
jgi:hypothetical protein